MGKEIKYPFSKQLIFAKVMENEGNLPKRCRYYSSALDVRTLKKGEEYNSLKACYVIFICPFDYFGLGDSVYFFERYNTKNHLSLGDQSYTIIVNTKGIGEDVPIGLKNLFSYINDGIIQTGDGFIKRIHEKVESIQEDKEVEYIMTLEEEYERRITAAERRASERGLKQGREQTIAELEKVNKLTEILLDENRLDDLRKAAADTEYQRQLMAEFNL